MSPQPTILFVYYQNAGRSRMAEAYLSALAGDRYQAASAGPAPAEHTHSEAIEVMAEDGIVIDDRPGEKLTPERAAESARVVTLNCAIDNLPVATEAWDIPDVEGDKLERARAQRDAIRQRVTTLIEELDRETAGEG